MLNQNPFNYLTNIKQRVEVTFVAWHNTVKFVSLYVDQTTCPRVLGNNLARLTRDIIREKPKSHLNHFLSVLRLKRAH
jgi:hypothetical protein